jgi:hypothetical protein
MSQNMNAPNHAGASEHAFKMTHSLAGLILLAVICSVTAFLVLCHLLRIESAFAGFFFLLLWGGVQRFDMQKLLPNTVGALVGIGLAYTINSAPGIGIWAIVISLVIVLIVTYLQILGRAAIVVNLSTMLYLTLCTAPPIATGSDYVDIVAAMLVASAFFGGLALLAATLRKRKQAAVADKAAPA